MTEVEVVRRGFLFGVAGSATLFAVPKLIVSRIPVVYGDGVHDDWEGLQSLMFGKPVRLLSGDTFAPGRAPKVSGGKFLLSDTLFMDERSSGAWIENCSMEWPHHRVDAPVINARNVEGFTLKCVDIRTNYMGPIISVEKSYIGRKPRAEESNT